MQNAGGMPQIESRNLQILDDQLKHEALACRKAEMYASQLTDQQLKTFANTIAQHHKQHFDCMQQYLNSHA